MSQPSLTEQTDQPGAQSFSMIVLGVIGLLIGSHWIVKAALAFSRAWGVSESFIGFTVLAVGTSLPELAASAVAAYKKNSEMALANVLGSNVFNVLFILGLVSVVTPLPFSSEDQLNWQICLFSSALLPVLVLLNKKRILGRVHGLIFLTCYIAYLVYLIRL